MPIIRGQHSFDAHFTQVPNAWLRDSRLTYKARGLLAELLSHKIGWEVSIARIANQGPDGRDAIGSAIQELESLGYLRREQQRDANGRLAGNLWITQDPSDLPLPEKPLTDNPHPKKTIDKKTIDKNLYAQFEEFWGRYPRRVGRANALKAFVGLSEQDRVLSIAGADSMAHDPNLPEMQFVPYPATWLNREGWLDDPYPERKRTAEELASARSVESSRRAQKEREASKALMGQLAEAEQKAKADPPKRCEHDTIAVICKVCAKVEKNRGAKNG
jgi:hypothetical protein